MRAWLSPKQKALPRRVVQRERSRSGEYQMTPPGACARSENHPRLGRRGIREQAPTRHSHRAASAAPASVVVGCMLAGVAPGELKGRETASLSPRSTLTRSGTIMAAVQNIMGMRGRISNNQTADQVFPRV